MAQDLLRKSGTNKIICSVIAYQAPEERPICRQRLATFHTTSLKTWIGGYRNKAEAWEEPKNWYPEGVPSWTDKVILGGYSRHACQISSRVDDISALSVLAGATLKIKPGGKLVVDGLLSDPLGILGDSGLSNAGVIQNKGVLVLQNAPLKGLLNNGLLINEGTLCLDKSISTETADWGEYRERGDRLFLTD